MAETTLCRIPLTLLHTPNTRYTSTGYTHISFNYGDDHGGFGEMLGQLEGRTWEPYRSTPPMERDHWGKLATVPRLERPLKMPKDFVRQLIRSHDAPKQKIVGGAVVNPLDYVNSSISFYSLPLPVRQRVPEAQENEIVPRKTLSGFLILMDEAPTYLKQKQLWNQGPPGTRQEFRITTTESVVGQVGLDTPQPPSQ
jgi:hypothetical protein